MRRNKLSPEEAAKVLSRPFDIWPEPSEEAKAKGITKRGPLPWQTDVFNFLQPWSKRLQNNSKYHCCPNHRDIVYSGSGSGKSILIVALHFYFMTKFPGCVTFSGAFRLKTINEIQKPIFKSLLSIRSSYDHPWLTHVPNDREPYYELTVPTYDEFGEIVYKSSQCWLGQLSDDEILRGKTLVYASAEELSQVEDPMIIDELERRLRSAKSPYNMLLATTNPPDSMSHFLYDKWPSLYKLMPEFDGEQPKPKLCGCHYCPECEMSKENSGLWEWDENNYCSNPNCSWLTTAKIINEKNPEAGVPVERFKRPANRYMDLDGVVRDHYCPGRQDFWRVFNPLPQENFHASSTMMQTQKASQDEKTFRIYSMGSVEALTSDKLYPNYSYTANVAPNLIEIDPTRDIYWTHDHNNRPRCSAVIQEALPEIHIVDEIVLYDSKVPRYDDDTKERIKGATVEDVCEEFINRYKSWNESSIKLGNQKTVWLHGDHTAWNQKGHSATSKNEFQIMKAMLTKAGFKVKYGVIKLQNRKNKIQISVKDRIALMNHMLMDSISFDKPRPRVKINRHCLHTHKSFSDLEKKNNDAEATDKSCDELARRTTNPNQIHLISHITEAIGYYFCRKFNLVKEGSGELRIIYIVDQAILDIQDDGTITKRKDGIPITDEKPKQTQIIDLIRQSIKDQSDDEGLGLFHGYFNI